MEGNVPNFSKVINDFVRRLYQKDKAIEIFRDVPEANQNTDMFETWNTKRFFYYKVALKTKMIVTSRIHLFRALGLLKGVLYIKS